MASFNINEKFDACICMANSLEILIKNEQFISHFRECKSSPWSGDFHTWTHCKRKRCLQDNFAQSKLKHTIKNVFQTVLTGFIFIFC